MPPVKKPSVSAPAVEADTIFPHHTHAGPLRGVGFFWRFLLIRAGEAPWRGQEEPGRHTQSAWITENLDAPE